MKDNRPTVGSLFSGGGGMDKGFEDAGFRVVWQCETNEACRQVLERRWPGVLRFSDARALVQFLPGTLPWPDLLAGGDPCPVFSRARMGRRSRSPDLSGYFLALAGRLRPWGVVRENVPSSGVAHFAAGLEALGYGTIVVRVDAAPFTAQQRVRDFVVGLYQRSRESVAGLFSDCQVGAGRSQKKIPPGADYAPCLCAHPARDYDSTLYVWEGGRLRLLDSEECEALAGFPRGWTEGLSRTARARITGNAVPPPVAEWIAMKIFGGWMDQKG
jgi:DNA (cytosine-5)-methyltransferase 1